MEPVKIQVPREDFLKQASQTCPYAKENKVKNMRGSSEGPKEVRREVEAGGELIWPA